MLAAGRAGRPRPAPAPKYRLLLLVRLAGCQLVADTEVSAPGPAPEGHAASAAWSPDPCSKNSPAEHAQMRACSRLVHAMPDDVEEARSRGRPAPRCSATLPRRDGRPATRSLTSMIGMCEKSPARSHETPPPPCQVQPEPRVSRVPGYRQTWHLERWARAPSRVGALLIQSDAFGIEWDEEPRPVAWTGLDSEPIISRRDMSSSKTEHVGLSIRVSASRTSNSTSGESSQPADDLRPAAFGREGLPTRAVY